MRTAVQKVAMPLFSRRVGTHDARKGNPEALPQYAHTGKTAVARKGLKIRTTRIAGGLLWPCKGLLPAAPKDAGFHAVQAQSPCHLGYPLKGS